MIPVIKVYVLPKGLPPVVKVKGNIYKTFSY